MRVEDIPSDGRENVTAKSPNNSKIRPRCPWGVWIQLIYSGAWRLTRLPESEFPAGVPEVRALPAEVPSGNAGPGFWHRQQPSPGGAREAGIPAYLPSVRATEPATGVLQHSGKPAKSGQEYN